jgi:DNA-binding HxlR family transcriptional regulator
VDPDEPGAGPEPSADDRSVGGNRAAAGRTRPDNARWDRAGEILAAVNGRWTFPILRHLASGESRPADLLTAINASAPGGRLSRKVLLETLRRMSQSGMIRRQEISRRPRETHYWLTETGHEILNEISKLGGTTLG